MDRITSYNVCYTKLLRKLIPAGFKSGGCGVYGNIVFARENTRSLNVVGMLMRDQYAFQIAGMLVDTAKRLFETAAGYARVHEYACGARVYEYRIAG